MARPVLTNNALLRWLEAVAGIDVDEIRGAIEASLEHAFTAAEAIGGGDYLIVSGGLIHVVREGAITTVLNQRGKSGEQEDCERVLAAALIRRKAED